MQDREYILNRDMLVSAWFNDAEKGVKALENVVQVRVLSTRRVGLYRHNDLMLCPHDMVIVETGRGTAAGIVLSYPEKRFVSLKATKRVIRKIEKAGASTWQESHNTEREINARKACNRLIAQLKLNMKLVKVEYVPWENRYVFYFTADGRVDFRELVKELSRALRCRVEMRQIGPRDEAKMLGGIGRCGRELCCATYLCKFASVRTKMAKEQGLVVNDEKLTGHCRKLLCCLAYERQTYLSLRASLPSVGARVKTVEGPGKVVELHMLRQVAKVMLDSGSVKDFPVDSFLCDRDRDAGSPQTGLNGNRLDDPSLGGSDAALGSKTSEDLASPTAVDLAKVMSDGPLLEDRESGSGSQRKRH